MTVLEAAELPLLRVLGREVAEAFAGLHREHGVDLRFGVQVAEITGSGGRADGVRLADGGHIAADAVVVGIGITPNTPARRGGRPEVGNGIVVDAGLRFPIRPGHLRRGGRRERLPSGPRPDVRVEHWANALHQPQTAARAMLGQDVAYDQDDAVLLHRPIRPGHGVRRLCRAGRL